MAGIRMNMQLARDSMRRKQQLKEAIKTIVAAAEERDVTSLDAAARECKAEIPSHHHGLLVDDCVKAVKKQLGVK